MPRAHAPDRTFFSFPIRIESSLVDTNAWYLEPNTTTSPPVFERLTLDELRACFVGIVERTARPEEAWVRFGPPIEHEPPPNLSKDQIHTLVDLARAGDETTFRDLARMLGVPAEDLDAMWSGTRKRVA